MIAGEDEPIPVAERPEVRHHPTVGVLRGRADRRPALNRADPAATSCG
ncbi:hypothetical protein [Kribbella sp. VKM Ac-2566]|nr:hypothetical protein [Kribbella sp. VKM Ac-2566]